MAWRSSGTSNATLVENLCANELIVDRRVKEAFLKVDRGDYAPRAPYDDRPQSIGHSATISAPHMHAAAIEQLVDFLVPSAARPAPRALDVGSGSGYLTHLMAHLAGAAGVVVGVEHVRPLVERAERNAGRSAHGRALLANGRLRFRLGDGRDGWPPAREADRLAGAGAVPADGYDAIHVGAGAAELHTLLLAQLRAPGRMFIPMDDTDGSQQQHVWVVDKAADGTVAQRRLFAVRYVPLTDRGYYCGDEETAE